MAKPNILYFLFIIIACLRQDCERQRLWQFQGSRQSHVKFADRVTFYTRQRIFVTERWTCLSSQALWTVSVDPGSSPSVIAGIASHFNHIMEIACYFCQADTQETKAGCNQPNLRVGHVQKYYNKRAHIFFFLQKYMWTRITWPDRIPWVRLYNKENTIAAQHWFLVQHNINQKAKGRYLTHQNAIE